VHISASRVTHTRTYATEQREYYDRLPIWFDSRRSSLRGAFAGNPGRVVPGLFLGKIDVAYIRTAGGIFRVERTGLAIGTEMQRLNRGL
jgi:hypothetical protein